MLYLKDMGSHLEPNVCNIQYEMLPSHDVRLLTEQTAYVNFSKFLLHKFLHLCLKAPFVVLIL